MSQVANTNSNNVDPIQLEIVRSSLGGIVQEMQNSLFRTGFSTIVRESQDASCAITNPKGEVIAQHVVLPLHIGAFPACVQAVLRDYSDIEEGDAFLINHPYEGGSPHAPDMAVITPAFYQGELIGFCGSIAHKGDIGGPVPGSCSGQAKETYNEGLHLPAVRYEHKGKAMVEIERIIATNSRTAELVLGDIRGQVGCDRLGEQRLSALLSKYGKEATLQCFDELMLQAEQKMRKTISSWQDGRYEAERFIDDDGINLEQPIRIHVVVQKRGQEINFDFIGSADQAQGPANIRPPLVQAAIGYVLVSLVDAQMFINSGLLKAFTMETREGSVLNPRFPAPVNTYNPTVHALVEALYGALTDIVPELARADGCGSRSIIIGGQRTSGQSYVQYEILGGGGGARASKDGGSGTSVNQSNAKIAPIEIVESEFPTRLLRFELIRDSGGAGKFRGGLGIRREYVNLEDARFSIRSTKHVIPPRGAGGGGDGRTGDIVINPDSDKAKRLPTRYSDFPLQKGDTFRLETPGGGGFGNAFERDPESVLQDVIEGYVSPERAETDYGVVLTEKDGDFALDLSATQQKRA